MIYCVEDDDNIRELVIYTLETTGLKAKGFADGAAFMEALIHRSWSCWILCCPGMMEWCF